MLIVSAVVLVVVGGVTAGVLLTRSTTGQPSAPPTAGAPAVPLTTATLMPAAPATTPGTSTSGPPAPSLAGLPLWPFAGAADVVAWQREFRSGGHQPWHVDAGLTALSFTRSYLDYPNVDKVITIARSGRSAWVAVGFDNPNGQPVESAVLHLVRFGAGADAPWEVVGTRDTTLALTTPAYGSTVRSPVTVGGLITGVDDSLRLQVRALTSSGPLGGVAGVPAGGDRTAWQVGVQFAAPSGHGVLTIAVATGGHIEAVERFAITGVRY